MGFIITGALSAFDEDHLLDEVIFIKMGICAFWPLVWLVFLLALMTVIPYDIGKSWLDKTSHYPEALKGDEILAEDMYGNRFKGIYLGGVNIAVVYAKTKIDTSTIRITNKHRITKLGKLLYKKNKP